MSHKGARRGDRWNLAVQLTRRDIGSRYKGSVLGVFWSLLTPLFLLLIYTFVFGAVFQSRWPVPEGTGAEVPSLAEFALILFTGLVVFYLFSDVVTRAPGLILANKNYVTRIVFPLEILPVVALGSALFQFVVSMSILIVAVILTFGGLSVTLIAMPLIILPYCILILGLGWLFAALGVFMRDINQFLATVVSGLMFLGPVFFARSILPDTVATWIMLNPITVPIEEMRKILIFGDWPDFKLLGIYTLVALAIALLGWLVFGHLQKGFADVV